MDLAGEAQRKAKTNTPKEYLLETQPDGRSVAHSPFRPLASRFTARLFYYRAQSLLSWAFRH